MLESIHLRNFKGYGDQAVTAELAPLMAHREVDRPSADTFDAAGDAP